jgi:hypothetical protein
MSTIKKFNDNSNFGSTKINWDDHKDATWEEIFSQKKGTNRLTFSINSIKTQEGINKGMSFINTIENENLKYDDKTYDPSFNVDFDWGYFSDSIDWGNVEEL